jgi:hypothetical protein
MDNAVEFAKRVAHQAQVSLGEMFVEGDETAFNKHIQRLINQGDVPVQKRIATLFANWSNLHSLGEEIQVGYENLALGVTLRDRKFSILNELIVLCPLVIDRVIGVKLEIKGNGEREMFTAILTIADQMSREQRLTDRDSVELLFKMLGAWAQNELVSPEE